MISVRIPKELKRKLEELNVNVSGVVRQALEERVRELGMVELREGQGGRENRLIVWAG